MLRSKNGEPLKILNVHNVASHYRAPLFRKLSDRYDQTVIFFQGEKSWREAKNPMDIEGYNAVALPGMWPFRFSRLARRLFFSRYDLLVMTFSGKVEPAMALLAAKVRRKPCVLWHGIWKTPDRLVWRISMPFLGRFFRSWPVIITYGAHTKETLQGFGVPAEKIVIAPQTVDNTLYSRPVSKAEVSALRRRWELDKQRQHAVLFVGRLTPQKGMHVLLDAFRRMDDDRWRLVAVGDGPLAPALEKAGAVLPGWVPPRELATYFAAADCLVLPSITTPNLKETWGLVVNEAFNQGLPVIVTDAVGAAAGGLAKHLVNALVIPEKDPKALADALTVLADNPTLRRELGENAKKEITQWTYTVMVDRFEEAFEMALKKRSHAQ